jgi:hypothetical protein
MPTLSDRALEQFFLENPHCLTHAIKYTGDVLGSLSHNSQGLRLESWSKRGTTPSDPNNFVCQGSTVVILIGRAQRSVRFEEEPCPLPCIECTQPLDSNPEGTVMDVTYRIRLRKANSNLGEDLVENNKAIRWL